MITKVEKRDETGHDGGFLLGTEHITVYFARYAPRCLRNSITSAKHWISHTLISKG